MKLSFWENPKAQGAIEGILRDEVLSELCTRRQSCLLATPYLSFDSRMMEVLDGEIRVRATMSRDAAKHTLSQQPLKLRFPWGLAFYAGVTRVLGYEQGEQRRTLRLAIPERLEPDEQREAFRLERVGRCQGAIGTSAGDIIRVSLENLSTLGAGVFCMEPIPPEGFQAGRAVTLSLTLEQGPSLRLETKVCHGQGQYLGLKLEPRPLGETLKSIEEWLAPRIEEARRHWENRAELLARAEQAAKPKLPPSGILLLSRDEALGAQVASALQDLHTVRVAPPIMAPYKEALETPPLLLLVDATGSDMEERHRLRGLLDAQPPGCPVIVMGQGGNNPDIWRSLVVELKARLFIEWYPENATFFRRLVLGLIRRHWKGRENYGKG